MKSKDKKIAIFKRHSQDDPIKKIKVQKCLYVK